MALHAYPGNAGGFTFLDPSNSLLSVGNLMSAETRRRNEDKRREEERAREQARINASGAGWDPASGQPPPWLSDEQKRNWRPASGTQQTSTYQGYPGPSGGGGAGGGSGISIGGGDITSGGAPAGYGYNAPYGGGGGPGGGGGGITLPPIEPVRMPPLMPAIGSGGAGGPYGGDAWRGGGPGAGQPPPLPGSQPGGGGIGGWLGRKAVE